MAVLIDREGLLKRKIENMIDAFGIDFQEEDILFSYSDIENAPTIDAEPVVHGHWVECKTANYHWCCSHCGYGYTDNPLTFCYDCGAKMDEVSG